MTTKERHLYYLTELKDYKVNHKDPDIRGWEVKDLDNRTIGKVENLLVNKELGKVVYIDVEVDQSIINLKHDPFANTGNTDVHEFINKEGENHIIIPIGLIDLNTDKKYVFTETINYETFAETKRYRSGTTISRNYEHHVLGSYQRNREYTDNDELRHTRSAYSHSDARDSSSIKDRDHREHYDEPGNDIEEKIRREKENLRKASDKNSEVAYEGERRIEEREQLKPDRTLDEDNNWKRDNAHFEDDEDLNQNRRRLDYDEDEFYNKREFKRK